jgi:hypothetical protein
MPQLSFVTLRATWIYHGGFPMWVVWFFEVALQLPRVGTTRKPRRTLETSGPKGRWSYYPQRTLPSIVVHHTFDQVRTASVPRMQGETQGKQRTSTHLPMRPLKGTV